MPNFIRQFSGDHLERDFQATLWWIKTANNADFRPFRYDIFETMGETAKVSIGHTGFRLVPVSMTLNDRNAPLAYYIQRYVASVGACCLNANEDRPIIKIIPRL